MTVLTHEQIHAGAQAKRDQLDGMRRARPYVRLWTNKPDGSPGLALMGVARDSISGDFPWKKNQFGTTGTLRIRLDHYLAKWILSIPDDPAAKKNIIITVDHYGGKVRWSGLLKFFKATKKNGLWYLDITFIDDLQYLQFMLGAPNPILPIPLFQFPRVLPVFACPPALFGQGGKQRQQPRTCKMGDLDDDPAQPDPPRRQSLDPAR